MILEAEFSARDDHFRERRTTNPWPNMLGLLPSDQGDIPDFHRACQPDWPAVGRDEFTNPERPLEVGAIRLAEIFRSSWLNASGRLAAGPG